ncbi:MAG: class I adenylate-forming enzyme family protein [Candidatus Omnitrophica bacterium]|nr:class I adenylate-forming enzyme family protein [Candidatus Omnitrophota bacterium]
MINIVNVITQETKNHLNRNAVIDGDKVITYAHLLEAINKTSIQLKKLGITRFKRIALLCDDSIDYIVMSLAVLKLYAVIVPIPFGSAQDEIDTLLKNLKVNFLIFQQDSYPQKNAQTITKNISITKLAAKGKVATEFYKINPAFIRFSSGTTGVNKGVILSHKSIIQRTTAANQGLKIKPGEQVIWVLSMSFHFVVTILLFLRRGATIILSSRNFPQDLLRNLNQYPATFIYASPLHYHLLTCLNIPKKSLSNVRLAISTAIKLPKIIAEKFNQKFGFPLAESYGIIEIGLPFVNTSSANAKRGSVGKILPDYKIKILNKDAQGIGEICIKGKGMFDAYFYPWIVRDKALLNGWFNTGDLGRLDKDGFLFILGRLKQVINFNGMKIFPFEVESLLNTYPYIKESLVYGKAHQEYGQLPIAKIVLKNPRETLNPEILRKFCYQHLASYKVPKEFEFVSHLPKTVSGKLKIIV